MKLSIIIPTYNEAKNLPHVIENVRAVHINMEKEIIIVDDGSTDGSRQILEDLEESNIRTYYHSENRGKGCAVRTGLSFVSGDIVIIQDADLEYDPKDYPALIQPIVEGRTSVVYGSRRLSKSSVSYARYLWGSWFLTRIANLLFSSGLTDLYTCYKVFRTDVIQDLDLKCRGFEFCPEVTAKLSHQHTKITEVPISYHPRVFSEGKKIRWHDGLIGLWTLIQLRFWNRLT